MAYRFTEIVFVLGDTNTALLTSYGKINQVILE